MTQEIEALREHPVFRHFYQISQIPHGSGNEQALSYYLEGWARGLGLEAEQDEQFNVLVRKPASPGYEDVPGVMLQAHIDMVCEKAEDSDHDFAKDPIQWVVENDILSTGGRTTLGADDGAGVALIMAVLEDDRLQHPAIEALFTTNEEEDMSGANGFDNGKMCAHYLINLDHTVDSQIMCGSCGGMQVDVRVPLELSDVPEGWKAYRLSVSGLKGGHSGEDIHRGRGNANILLARLLMAVESCCDFRLLRVKGGTFRLAIPREAEAVLAIDPAHESAVQTAVSKLKKDFRAELAATAGNVKVSLEPAQGAARGAVPAPVIHAMTLIPDGIHQMNEVLTGLVDTSDNLGEVYLEENELHFVLEIRSARESLGKYLLQRMERLAAVLGGTCESCRAYPSWNFRPASRLREIAVEQFKSFYGADPDILTVHAGLEVGYLLEGNPDIDAISLGPNCFDFHSPTESLQISSMKKFYTYLCRILAAIRQTAD